MEPKKIGKLAVWEHEARTPWARCLMLHGLGEHSGRHKHTLDYLAAHGVSGARFDFRGTGRSDGTRQWIDAFSDYVDDVLAVADGLLGPGHPPLFLFGHSMGGATAIYAAPRLGNRLAGLVLSAPAYLPGAGVSRAKILVGRCLDYVWPKLRIPGVLDLEALSRDPEVAKAYASDPLTCRFNTVRQGNAILRALDGIPLICGEIEVPVLIVHGEKDRLVRVEGSREILEKLGSKDKRLVEFKDGYHELHNDLERDKYFSLVLGWMRERA